jgi:hypothetical protein
MADETRNIEIFDVCGASPDDLHLLVHVEPFPDDEESYRAVVVRWSLRGLSVEHVLETWARSMWRSPAGTVYVAGTDGTIRSNPGGPWVKEPIGPRYTLNTVWGLSDQLIYCSAFRANFFRRNANAWQLFNDGLHGDLFDIGGTAPDDLYVLGDAGTVFHCDGVRWSEVESPTNKRLVAVWAPVRGDVYFCGWKGAFFRLRNNRWENYSLEGGEIDLYSMAYYNERVFAGAGSRGVFSFDGQRLALFAEGVVASRVRVIGDRLLAVGRNIVQQYDGRSWTRTELNLDGVIPAQLP